MESKEELINNLKEREEYLEGEWYQLRDLANEMGERDDLEGSDFANFMDLALAIEAIQMALGAVRNMIVRTQIRRKKR